VHSFFTADPKHAEFYYVRIALGIVFGLAFIGLLQIVPPSRRRSAIGLATFLGGLFYAVEFFKPVWHYSSDGHWHAVSLTKMLPAFGTLSTDLQAFAIGLGIVNLLNLHLKNIARKRGSWGNSFVLISAFFAMLLWGLLNAYYPDKVLLHQGGLLSAPITNADIYDFLFYGGYANLDASMFALIGFFIVSASYRAFRIRSAEASLLMAAAVIVMLGQVTLGTTITANLPATGFWANFRFENLGLYLLKEFNAPAFRAINFGIGIGFLATSLRLWLSLERGAYFDTEG
jgi:hypothetical protein